MEYTFRDACKSVGLNPHKLPAILPLSTLSKLLPHKLTTIRQYVYRTGKIPGLPILFVQDQSGTWGAALKSVVDYYANLRCGQ